MSWIRWTKKQLRLYMSRDLYRQDIHNELSSMDEDISPRVTCFDGMPKGKGGSVSTVERQVEYREEARGRLLQQFKEASSQIEQIKDALSTLQNNERSALELAFMRTFYDTDKEIAKCLKIPLKEFWRLKINALHKIYINLKGVTHTIDVEELISQEEQKHNRSMKLKEERREERERRRKEAQQEWDQEYWLNKWRTPTQEVLERTV